MDAAAASSSGDAGLVPTVLKTPGCQGHHDPKNGPQLPGNGPADSSFDWGWDDRSCKQQHILSDHDDAMAMRCIQPTPVELYRLFNHFSGMPEHLPCLKRVITYWGQPQVENDTRVLLKAVIEGLRCYPRLLGFPAVSGTSEFSLCKCLLACSRAKAPATSDPTELCFCFTETSLMIYGCKHYNLGCEHGVAIYNTLNYNIGCSNCSKCLRCRGYLDHMWKCIRW